MKCKKCSAELSTEDELIGKLCDTCREELLRELFGEIDLDEHTD